MLSLAKGTTAIFLLFNTIYLFYPQVLHALPLYVLEGRLLVRAVITDKKTIHPYYIMEADTDINNIYLSQLSSNYESINNTAQTCIQRMLYVVDCDGH